MRYTICGVWYEPYSSCLYNCVLLYSESVGGSWAVRYSVCQCRKYQPLDLIFSTLQGERALKNVFFLQNLILYKVRKNIDEIAIRFNVLEINFSFAE